ncbi:MAG: hypothetical protein KC583_05905, partial [Myxococcales bacterium]|nr:hypothetical protein [Myxococcales bacterium]
MSAHGQWAVVLGASAGVGARIAEALAADPGLNVFAIHRGNWPEGAAQVRRAVNALGREYVEWRAVAIVAPFYYKLSPASVY